MTIAFIRGTGGTVSGVLASIDSAPPAPTPPRFRTPDLVATVAAAAAQGTPSGQEIHRLVAVGDKLYVAYGDYNGNTGPIDVLALDLTTQTLQAAEVTLDTEEIWTVREVAGSVYIPYVDPRSGTDHLAVKTGGAWAVVSTVVPAPVHVFDLAVTSDGLFLFGSANEPDPPNGGATVWRSTDGGATWAVDLAPRPDDTNVARFYAAWQFGDDLYAQVSTPGVNVLYRRTAGAWAEITDPAGVRTVETVPFTWQGTPFMLCLGNGKNSGVSAAGALTARTSVADEATRAAIQASLPSGSGFCDVAVDGGFAYALDKMTGDVWRGDTTGTWTLLFRLPSPPASIAAAGDYLYFGTGDSRILRTPIPA